MILRLCRDGLAQHLVNMALAPPKGAKYVEFLVAAKAWADSAVGRQPNLVAARAKVAGRNRADKANRRARPSQPEIAGGAMTESCKIHRLKLIAPRQP